MLFFMDESFQNINGTRVGALGAVGIPDASYNRFCGIVHSVKRQVFDASELTDHELKGSGSFSRAVFRIEGEAKSLQAVDRVIDALQEVGGVVFARWTDTPELLSLRNTSSSALTGPYVRMFQDFCCFMRTMPNHDRGAIFLDQLGHTEDKHAACTIANYMARHSDRYALQRHILQVPHYTHSVVSPGLQMADLVAYLAANQYDPSARPELRPWWERFEKLSTFTYARTKRRSETCEAAGPYDGAQRRLRLRW